MQSRLTLFNASQTNHPLIASEPALILAVSWHSQFLSQTESPDSPFNLPIDNQSIIKDNELDPNASFPDDFVCISRQTWDLLNSWYGGGPELSIQLATKEGSDCLIPRRARPYIVHFRNGAIPFDGFDHEKVATFKGRFCETHQIGLNDLQVYINSEQPPDDRCLVDCKSRELVFQGPKVVPLGICGIQNIGNSCYLSAAVECLAHLPSFVKYFSSGRYREDVNRSNPAGTDGKVATEFGELCSQIWSQEVPVVHINELKAAVGTVAPVFATFDAQDSHEFLLTLLNILHEDLRVDDHSFISSLFDGLNRQITRCPECGTTFESDVPFFCLSLPLIPPSVRIPLIFIPFDLALPPQVLQFDLQPHFRRSDLEWQIKRLINNPNDLIFAVKSPGSTYRFSLPSSDLSTVSYAFEVPNPDSYHAIVTVNGPVGLRLTEFSNPFLIELPALDISHDLLTDLIARRLDPFWLNPIPNSSSETLFVRLAFNFHANEKFRVHKVSSWKISSKFRRFLNNPFQVYLNPNELHFERGFNWSLVHRMTVCHNEMPPLSLPACLEMLQYPQIQDEGNMYFCPICVRHVHAEKTALIRRAPNVLILQLNRFREVNGIREKNAAKVEIFEELDFARFVCGNKELILYDLVGVVQHLGNIEGGHYISFTKIENDWFMFNDAEFKPATFHEATGKDAYILFYQKR
jgi:ubiquitin C-terminal hydrolase